MLIAIGSVKGAPGATTLALGLAAVWPDRGAVVLECDPDGGDLATRFGHHPHPGLSSLAAAGRAGARPVDLAAHVQRLRLGVDVVLAPPGDSAAASVQTLAYGGADLLGDAARSGTVVLDVGRFARGGPGTALAAAADHVVLVARPTLDELLQVQTRLDWLRPMLRGRLWMACAGSGRYSRAEITRDLGVEVIGEVPHSKAGAGVLAGRLYSPTWRRLRLARAIRGIGEALAGHEPQLAPRHSAAEPVQVNT